jgi:hypothetical protein
LLRHSNIQFLPVPDVGKAAGQTGPSCLLGILTT